MYVRDSEGKGLSSSIYVERLNRDLPRLTVKGITKVRFGGWWRSKSLEEGSYIVKVYFKGFEESRRVELNDADKTVYFAFSRTQLPDKSKPKVARIEQADAGTKIYSSSAIERKDYWKLPSAEIRCLNCGIASSPDAKYCKNCGNTL